MIDKQECLVSSQTSASVWGVIERILDDNSRPVHHIVCFISLPNQWRRHFMKMINIYCRSAVKDPIVHIHIFPK